MTLTIATSTVFIKILILEACVMIGGHLFQVIICYAYSRFHEPMTTGFEAGIGKRRKVYASGGPVKVGGLADELLIPLTFCLRLF